MEITGKKLFVLLKQEYDSEYLQGEDPLRKKVSFFGFVITRHLSEKKLYF